MLTFIFIRNTLSQITAYRIWEAVKVFFMLGFVFEVIKQGFGF